MYPIAYFIICRAAADGDTCLPVDLHAALLRCALLAALVPWYTTRHSIVLPRCFTALLFQFSVGFGGFRLLGFWGV